MLLFNLQKSENEAWKLKKKQQKKCKTFTTKWDENKLQEWVILLSKEVDYWKTFLSGIVQNLLKKIWLNNLQTVT